jgi:hypothetical protein
MNATLVRSFLALIPVALLLAWSIGDLSKERTLGPLLAFPGATCLLIVVLTHVAVSLHLFAFMHWATLTVPDTISISRARSSVSR